MHWPCAFLTKPAGHVPLPWAWYWLHVSSPADPHFWCVPFFWAGEIQLLPTGGALAGRRYMALALGFTTRERLRLLVLVLVLVLRLRLRLRLAMRLRLVLRPRVDFPIRILSAAAYDDIIAALVFAFAYPSYSSAYPSAYSSAYSPASSYGSAAYIPLSNP